MPYSNEASESEAYKFTPSASSESKRGCAICATPIGGDAAAPRELILNGEPKYKGGDGAAAKSGEPSVVTREAAAAPPSESEGRIAEPDHRKRRRCTGGGSAIPASGMRGALTHSSARISRSERSGAAPAPPLTRGEPPSEPKLKQGEAPPSELKRSTDARGDIGG